MSKQATHRSKGQSDPARHHAHRAPQNGYMDIPLLRSSCIHGALNNGMVLTKLANTAHESTICILTFPCVCRMWKQQSSKRQAPSLCTPACLPTLSGALPVLPKITQPPTAIITASRPNAWGLRQRGNQHLLKRLDFRWRNRIPITTMKMQPAYQSLLPWAASRRKQLTAARLRLRLLRMAQPGRSCHSENADRVGWNFSTGMHPIDKGSRIWSIKPAQCTRVRLAMLTTGMKAIQSKLVRGLSEDHPAWGVKVMSLE